MRIAAFLITVLVAGATLAQTAPRSEQPGARLDPPDLPPEPASPDFSRSSTGAPAPAAQGNVDVRFLLKRVALTPADAPLATTDGLSAAIQAYLGATTDLAALEGLRRRLTEVLVEAGYVSSGVRLAEVDLDAGVATYRIIEGRVSETRIAGEGISERDLGDITPDYVEGRLALPGGAFNFETAEERLRILLRDRSIARVDAAVRPGAGPGDTVLDLNVTRKRPYDFSLTLANDTPNGIGEETLRLNGAFRGLVTSGDELRAELEISEGRRSIILDGDAPLWPGGPAPFFAFEYAQSEFVDAPLSTLDLENTFLRIGGGLRVPVFETSRRSLTGVLGFDYKRTKSSLLGQGFSFSPGVENGVAKTAVISLAGEFVDLGDDRTIALRAAANLGVSAFGATQNAGGVPDGRFTSLVAQAQVAQRLTPDLTLIARAQGQIASDALLPLEQVAIGGRETVRGFSEAVVSGDDGLVGSLEARISLADLPVPGLTPGGAAAPLTLAPFIEGGKVWRKNGGGSDTLIGAGAGLLWSPRPGVDAAFYVGAALQGAEDGGGLQGEGVHFVLTIALP